MLKRIFAVSSRFILALVVMMSISGAPVHAADCAVDGRSLFEAIPTWYKYLEVDCSTGEVTSFAFPGDIWLIAIAVIEILLRVAGMIAFGYTVFAGFKFVTSRGNPTEAAKARQTLLDAVIGIGIVTIATALVGFLGNTLAK